MKIIGIDECAYDCFVVVWRESVQAPCQQNCSFLSFSGGGSQSWGDGVQYY